MRRPLLAVLSVAAIASAGVAGGANAAVTKGTYKGTATKDVSRGGPKSHSLSFVVKVMPDCPVDAVKVRRTLCLHWQPFISVPVTCKSGRKVTHERRDVPYASAVSSAGRVRLVASVQGSTFRVTVAFRGTSATGRVSFKGQSVSGDPKSRCSGNLTFTARKR
jgi:hypothetical protein